MMGGGNSIVSVQDPSAGPLGRENITVKPERCLFLVQPNSDNLFEAQTYP